MIGKVLPDIINKIFVAKNYKKLVWIFIGVLMLVILIYPILDANFLYHTRETQRISLLRNLTSLDQGVIRSDSRLLDEYNAILDDLAMNRSREVSQVINFNDNANGWIKFISGAWLFVLVGLVILFGKNDKTKKHPLLNKFGMFLFCLMSGAILGWVAMIFPTVINILVNVILYQIILFFLAYTITTSTKKKL